MSVVSNYITKVKEHFHTGVTSVKKLMHYLHDEIADIKYKISNLAETNIELAMYHFERGNINDAIFRLKLLKRFNSEPEGYDYFLGRCYLEKYKIEKAKEHLNKHLNSDPQTYVEEAKYCLASIESEEHGSKVNSIPTSIVRHKFQQLAFTYNEIFILGQKELSQVDIMALLEERLDENGKENDNVVLDLGCGTGIMGQLCRESNLAQYICGVDISSNMLFQASKLLCNDEPTYNEHSCEDIMEYISNSGKQYDIIFGANLITYLNDLEAFFQGLHNVAKEKTSIALSFKTATNAKQRSFIPFIEEFYYNPKYVEEVALGHKWKLESSDDSMFPGNIPGKVFILTKAEASK